MAPSAHLPAAGPLPLTSTHVSALEQCCRSQNLKPHRVHKPHLSHVKSNSKHRPKCNDFILEPHKSQQEILGIWLNIGHYEMVSMQNDYLWKTSCFSDPQIFGGLGHQSVVKLVFHFTGT